ncbi:MAG: MFS transporter [Prevotella sp.]|nr:MFS transporter [Prevotella sp.]
MQTENQPNNHISSKGRGIGLPMFFCLYIAQSIPSSFFATALQVMMREANYSLATIGLLQLVKLPWVVKFLWSPLVDRHCLTGRDFRRCIVVSEIVYAIFIILAGHLNVTDNLYLIIFMVMLSLVASATQDIATDALAILMHTGRDKSMVNSMQSMGSFGGALIGSGVLLLVLHRFGWHAVTPFLGVFVLLMLIPLLRRKDLNIAQKDVRQRARLTDFASFFVQRGIWRQIGFLLLYYASIIGILSMMRPWLVDLGYSMKEIGVMSGIIGTSSAFCASFGAGFIVRRIGIFTARILFACFILLTTLYFLGLVMLGTPTTAMLYGGIVLMWMSYGMATIVVYTSAMECVRPGREGTDFTVQTVLTHLSGIIMAGLSGAVADHFGYYGLFLAEVIIASISLFYIILLFRKPHAA